MIGIVQDVRFEAPNPYVPEMVDSIRESLLTDLTYELPLNYQKGAGDTYFSGKMLAKLARIVQIGIEIEKLTLSSSSNSSYSTWIAEYRALHSDAVSRLRAGVEIWLNGSALAPLVYDESWGGIVGCGCDYDGENSGCFNVYPDCPALVDPGQNYGSGFYNDHHFHYGYHIYAAAVLTKVDHAWGRSFHDHVMSLVRDIANPSESDPYFPMWRHKDWCVNEGIINYLDHSNCRYLGSSWASGIVTFANQPYPNGRNQESSSEAIAAYEAVALYGRAAAEVFAGNQSLARLIDPLCSVQWVFEGQSEEERKARASCEHVYNMGRLLMATEIRSAQVKI